MRSSAISPAALNSTRTPRGAETCTGPFSSAPSNAQVTSTLVCTARPPSPVRDRERWSIRVREG